MLISVAAADFEANSVQGAVQQTQSSKKEKRLSERGKAKVGTARQIQLSAKQPKRQGYSVTF